MMQSVLLTILFLASVLAVPTNSILNIRQGPGGPPSPCSPADVAGVALPVAPTPLPAPAEGDYLASITVGRGVQNYTCAADDAAVKPVAIGAIATLYSAGCVAFSDSAAFDKLAGEAFDLTLPEDSNADLGCPSGALKRAGNHFFSASGTPNFDFRGVGNGALGLSAVAKQANSTAPVSGAVPWLLLGQTTGTEGPVTKIYRLNTVGGVAPANCAGQVAGQVIEVQYAAQYWVYSSVKPETAPTPPEGESPPADSPPAGPTPSPTPSGDAPPPPAPSSDAPPPPPAPSGDAPPAPAPPAGTPPARPRRGIHLRPAVRFGPRPQ